jgi:hypothetical protein
MKSNRDLLTLIRMMQNFIPLDLKSVHAQLNSIAGSVPYTPPECMGEKFIMVAEALSEIPNWLEKPVWLKAVISIWMNERFDREIQ